MFLETVETSNGGRELRSCSVGKTIVKRNDNGVLWDNRQNN
jgi:hypothetical protein